MANSETNRLSDADIFDLMVDSTQEEDLFYAPSSTAVSEEQKDKLLKDQELQEYLLNVSHDSVEGTPLEKSWLDMRNKLYGEVAEEKRSAVQKKADDFYQSGLVGATAAAAADILPGIPFVDIIDPPEELVDEGMESARGILGSLGVVGGLYKTPQVAGRVATNIRQPWGYGETRRKIAYNINQYGGHRKSVLGKAKTVARSILKDEPLYGAMDTRKKDLVEAYQSQVFPERAASDAREFLYRKAFGLKPRAGKNIFIENPDGTFSFNPKSVRGKKLLKEVGEKASPTDHSVMGGYARKVGRSHLTSPKPTFHGQVDYEDVWDFKMHPSEWKKIFRGLMKPSEYSVRPWGPGSEAQGGAWLKRDIRSAALRTIAEMLIKPPHIKGTYTGSIHHGLGTLPTKKELAKYGKY